MEIILEKALIDTSPIPVKSVLIEISTESAPQDTVEGRMQVYRKDA